MFLSTAVKGRWQHVADLLLARFQFAIVVLDSVKSSAQFKRQHTRHSSKQSSATSSSRTYEVEILSLVIVPCSMSTTTPMNVLPLTSLWMWAHRKGSTCPKLLTRVKWFRIMNKIWSSVHTHTQPQELFGMFCTQITQCTCLDTEISPSKSIIKLKPNAKFGIQKKCFASWQNFNYSHNIVSKQSVLPVCSKLCWRLKKPSFLFPANLGALHLPPVPPMSRFKHWRLVLCCSSFILQWMPNQHQHIISYIYI